MNIEMAIQLLKHEWKFGRNDREIEVEIRVRRAKSYFEFFQTFTIIPITYMETGGKLFSIYLFYKITHRKLKSRTSLLYQSINSPYRIMMAYNRMVFHTVMETRLYFINNFGRLITPVFQ